MYRALIKHQLTRPSAFHITRLARASVSEKARPDTKGNEECMLSFSLSEIFVTTTFPDDYESSPLQPDLLEPRQTAAAASDKGNVSDNEVMTQGTTEQHKADIYDSLWGKEAQGRPKKQTTARDEALEAEHEPDIDEM
ncbi:hypothetical protein N7532_011628 [Penicillium argentinense]|uniref:Uncharacterized protein n=1 Tax=Penicillium argentinense TaxID=1131581 RepID=A0A9W9EIZ5_9EURO|nr:uncharacterized protein N7532_011628 [Penicillium argentinense]KAJ5082585.1 hypothetical protein N7532_011628 [Penicillium argentinense]